MNQNFLPKMIQNTKPHQRDKKGPCKTKNDQSNILPEIRKIEILSPPKNCKNGMTNPSEKDGNRALHVDINNTFGNTYADLGFVHPCILLKDVDSKPNVKKIGRYLVHSSKRKTTTPTPRIHDYPYDQYHEDLESSSDDDFNVSVIAYSSSSNSSSRRSSVDFSKEPGGEQPEHLPQIHVPSESPNTLEYEKLLKQYDQKRKKRKDAFYPLYQSSKLPPISLYGQKTKKKKRGVYNYIKLKMPPLVLDEFAEQNEMRKKLSSNGSTLDRSTLARENTTTSIGSSSDCDANNNNNPATGL